MLAFGVLIALCAVGCKGVEHSDGGLTTERPGDVDVKVEGLIPEKGIDCNTENGTCHTNTLGKIYAAVGKRCNCGAHSVGCTFVNNKKICTCEYGYGQAPNGTCIKPCGCKNNMYCEQNLCVCRFGDMHGDRCENLEECEGWKGPYKCGDPLEVTCGYDFRTGKRCVCKNPAHFYDSKERICGECECGPNSEECSLEGGTKKCKCKDDYVMAEKGAYLEGECRRCDCGPNTNPFDKCKFNSTGKFCNCNKGFSQRAGKCIKCTCGDHGTCSFEGYRKVCTCDKGYVMQDGKCVVCDCGPHCTCYYEKGKKIAKCNSDAIPFDGKCVECNCGRDGKCALNSEGKKTCTCNQYFGDREGYCIDCQCYLPDSKLTGCSFINKTQICDCPSGYKTVDFICLPENSQLRML